MSPITTSTTPTTTPRPAAAKRLSTPMRLPSFARSPKHTAALDAEADLWPRPRARRASSTSSTSSSSSSSSTSSATSSSSDSASSSSSSGAPSTKKRRSRKVRAVDMIIDGVSSLLIMPMPFLKRGSSPPPPPAGAADAVPPRKRRFSLPFLFARPARRIPTMHQKRKKLPTGRRAAVPAQYGRAHPPRKTASSASSSRRPSSRHRSTGSVLGMGAGARSRRGVISCDLFVGGLEDGGSAYETATSRNAGRTNATPATTATSAMNAYASELIESNLDS
ncbi:hypothetical protein DFH09DRAFT_1106067 [Mycena vulgaris]|nr:hypothetical protein DFH09DRAFT_1106067 [Mycena vulgaris]